ncbi:MAG: DUF1499 domain-containing protein [Alphaproteobacteria bacterium]|nr:DUF1499 domain-containing protein [Alphaproteobacteria bacterium]
MRYQPFLARVSLGCFLLGAAVALTACLGTRLGSWPYALGLRILAPGVAVGAVGLVGGFVWIWRALAANNSLGWRCGIAGLFGSLLLVGIPADHLWLHYSLPPIHDVSTDIGDAPQFHSLLAWRKGAPNPATYDGPVIVTYNGERVTTALAQKYAYPDIKPLELLAGRMPPKEFFAKYFWRALNAVNALDWQVASFDLKTGRIEATDTGFWFGVVSDIVIRVRPAGAIGVRIDIRSKSRVGTADMGRNAEIVREFLEKEKGG